MSPVATHALSLAFYSLHELRALVEELPQLTLAPEVVERIAAGAQYVQKKAQEDRYIYGVNTGFGALCETRVTPEEVELLQYNHVVSHACGVGEIVPERISRLVMLIKLLTFRTGHTGVSLETVQRMLDFWNHGIIPAIPKKGTVGASGDLAPLAHMAMPLLGLGKVHLRGQLVDAMQALKERDWKPLRLKAKEGLALTNGVQYINALGANALMTIEELIATSDVIAALSLQGFSASRTFYQDLYHQTSFHEDRRIVAANLRRLLEGSNHFELPTCNKSMQDPYSFRCMPQVHAAIRQTFRFAKDTLEKEYNSVSDNPLFFPEQDTILFGGALHGESTAFVLDFLAIATSEVANISERRTYQLLSGQRGLPSFLVKHPGVNSGLMVIQYTSAALLNENKVLCTPASVDTIPTCQLQEDHVSMGGTSAYKLETVAANCEYILGIELLTAAQAIDFNEGLRLSPATERIHKAFRRQVSFLERDRPMDADINAAHQFIQSQRRAWTREFNLI
ncbi:histidine ammonia-lyase [Stigmatella sp. ncwal1]|uniref:Histidine ammonia-lyase n=1 Tax=Stigmatella ashevillensis TaxID=2995309 RepID=A0ABT5DAN4_9BACT|nr:histidine ammonia-lyase [Stigmatella ashevillena]MDC0710659.1 histidine ammonia-lyase [Stigmatella ashevillena]